MVITTTRPKFIYGSLECSGAVGWVFSKQCMTKGGGSATLEYSGAVGWAFSKQCMMKVVVLRHLWRENQQWF